MLARSSLAVAACALAVAACGSEDESTATPSACLDGPEAFVDALAAAPGEVTLYDGTPIEECLTEDQEAGALSEVGGAMINAARGLNGQARKPPLGDAPVQLGYLVGAVEARADETGGIHQDLALNLEAEATFVPADELLPGGFQQLYEEGLAAGRGSG